jgi:prevent-host-death family protein
MRPVRISEDIVPVSDFKARAAEWLKRVSETGQPVVITLNGKAAGVLVSPAEFDRLTERARVLTAINAGLEDEQAGRLHSHEEVIAEMERRAASRKQVLPLTLADGDPVRLLDAHHGRTGGVHRVMGSDAVAGGGTPIAA